MSDYIYWIINPEGDKIERTKADTAKECLRKYGLLSRDYLPQGYGIYRVRNNGFNGRSLRECALAVAQVWERETSPEDSRVKFIMARLSECPEALISIVESDPVYMDQLNSLEEES